MPANATSVSGVTKNDTASVPTRTSERDIAIQAYASDPKFKKYAQQIEKCLNSFDNVHEWADCIAFLKQLLKTFQTYMQFKEIPRKLIVAKRLSQCLNPALPTGVHQRALEVYIHILTVLGPEGLKRDLSLWSSGLFPFFEYAATSVKPTLLNIYDTHYLPLQSSLRPIMRSFILALLPGLEEETGEFFEKVLNLLDRLSGAVSTPFYFQNIWLIMLTTPSARGTSLNFLSRRLPRLSADEDITGVVGKDIGLMIRAFASALEDENLLVRRAALDTLLQSMRLDSRAIRKAQLEDRFILMRAATGVVLRRDLSLNRRLYTWLLGPDEKSDHQIAYLRSNALELLNSTLKNEMFSPSGEYAESRPFKIFISLLDKWEIGAALTDSLIYDAFKAIKQLVQHPRDSSEDLIATATTLYEAVEPQILWKHLLSSIFDEILGGGSVEAIQLVHFILQSFPQDEEIKTIHLPIIFAGFIDVLDSQIQKDLEKATRQSIVTSWRLLESILDQIPQSALLQRPGLAIESEGDIRTPFDFSCIFYKVSNQAKPTTTGHQMSTVPLISCLENLLSLCQDYALFLFKGPQHGVILRESFCLIMALIHTLLVRLDASLNISWNPAEWLHVILSSLGHEAATFTIVDRLTSILVALHQSQYLEPKLDIDDRAVIHTMVARLLHYLHQDFSAYHVRVVNLLWSLQASTSCSHVESIVAQSMSTSELRKISEAYEAFGVIWRLSEDNQLPGFKFKVPMMIVLDALKSDSPHLRRIGETWMRCSLKSYIRVLDPILHDLLDPSILRTATVFKVRGRDLTGFLYERAFDQHIVNYLLETLLSIVTFGGQGFARAARTALVKRSNHSGFVQRVLNSNIVDADASYLDVLVEVLLRFVQSEPKPFLTTSMQSLNTAIQSNAIEGAIEAIVVGKLYFSVHTNRLDLQNKWLHLLHSVISVATSQLEASRKSAPTAHDENGPEIPGILDKGPDSVIRYPLNPLMTQTLVDGISTHSNRPVLQHWLDFILMAVPQFQPALQAVVTPLNDCLCRQSISALGDVLKAANQTDVYAEDFCTSSCVTSEVDGSEEEVPATEKSTTEASGLLGYVSNVFTSESSSSNQTDQLTDVLIWDVVTQTRSPGYRSLDEGIRVLYSIWASLVWKPLHVWSVKDDTLSLIYSRTRLRCRRVLEHLFRVQTTEVFESFVDWWSRETTLSTSSPDSAFELMDVLVLTAQNAVHMICESITARTLAISEKGRKQALNPNLTDATLFKFLEQYLRLWGRYIQLVKELLSTSEISKCLGVLADKVTQTTAMEDRRIRRELQDHYGRLLDICLVYVGRFTDQSSWMRRNTKEATNTSGRESPALRNNEKVEASTNPESSKLASIEILPQITSFVAASALPNLRKLLMENDKIVGACNNIVYYIVNPAMRGKTRPMDIDPIVIQILLEMTKLPVALKAWKSPVFELLNDNRVFNCSPGDAAKWLPIVKVLYDTDKTAFLDLLGKLVTATSANIFTNREYEMRNSLTYFAGVSSPVVQSEVFLCIRVLLCRLSPHNLTSFWPYVTFLDQSLINRIRTVPYIRASHDEYPCDGSEDLQLILSACKCLDTLLVLQTEEFQIHQWIFITDTVDAVYRSDDWIPEAIMDRLAEIAGSLPVGVTSSCTVSTASDNANPPESPALQPDRVMRRPLLASLRQVESLRDLVPFFSNVSISSYESVYASGGNIDWQAVENSILADMFDGR
ncbi:Dopey, N-terminal-domain-containing protein [Gymnopilus junonius]|uniref:Dopey, N-terminal-domain-containing protein n=1 Tax=Gymnopilus junonius TaxID=109634 RepID=A0A9P5P2L6_GYMJU|nr:Dopey, N-terminal-domain-containing protein [Gymnopilus junonius]